MFPPILLPMPVPLPPLLVLLPFGQDLNHLHYGTGPTIVQQEGQPSWDVASATISTHPPHLKLDLLLELDLKLVHPSLLLVQMLQPSMLQPPPLTRMLDNLGLEQGKTLALSGDWKWLFHSVIKGF